MMGEVFFLLYYTRDNRSPFIVFNKSRLMKKVNEMWNSRVFYVFISSNRYLIILFLNDYITKLLINNLLAEISPNIIPSLKTVRVTGLTEEPADHTGSVPGSCAE